MTVAVTVSVLPRRVVGWAARRSLAPNALTGIGLACSLCAAAWFTAGTRPAAIGAVLALGAWYSARRVRAQLVAVLAAGRDSRRGAAAAIAGLPMAAFEDWLASACAAVGEFAVYAGLAVGARASQRHGIWVLATGAAITLSLCEVARLCQPARAAAGPPRSSLLLQARQLLAWPAGERIAVIALTAPLWGPRTTFLALIVSGAVAALWVIAQSISTLISHRPADRGWLADDGRPADGGFPPDDGRPPDRGRPGGGNWPPDGGTAGPGMIANCRDDGPVARLADRIVQGQLAPLPPALAGLAATVLLAVLGLGNLPGILVLAPIAAMLLAAAGAGHPHDGRLDWLTPMVLQAAQYIYLAALGFSAGVPGPLTFGLISLIALRQLDVACRARQPGRWPAQPAGLGWDGRILVVALSALLGIVTFAYLALAAYVGVLLCRVSLAGWLAIREGERQ